jgi:lipopolysaccharide export system protein LptC
MTHPAETMNVQQGGSRFQPSRSGAFRSAGRHSKRVRFLRRIILFGCLGGSAALLVVGIFNPFGSVPKNISVAHTGLDGTKITMEAPKLSGYRQDGRPYQLSAARGVQDIRKPSIIELHEVDAHFTLTDNSVAHLESSAAVFDSARNFMTFPHPVQITSNSGYEVHLQSAEMDVKAGTMTTHDPVSMRMTKGTIAADSLATSEGGQETTFEGNVRSVFASSGNEAATAGEVAGKDSP